MAGANSIIGSRKSKAEKPNKPYPEFPLTAHPKGQWCKKIRGKVHYFGRWEDPEGSVEKYKRQRTALESGLEPDDETITYDLSRLTVEALCNLFLDFKLNEVESGELAQPTYDNYRSFIQRILKELGRSKLVEDIRPSDFERLKRSFGKPKPQLSKDGKVIRPAKDSVSHKSIETIVSHCRAVFNWGAKNYYIKVPMAKLWGTKFDKPKRKTLRKERNSRPQKTASGDEINRLVLHANPAMKAMILLGVNCGFGNTDVSCLEFSHLDLMSGVVEFPRVKTAEDRRAFLWPETIDAINEYLTQRPEPTSQADKSLVFLTSAGSNWKVNGTNRPVTREFSRLRDRKSVNAKRPGLSFYSLRHTFQTVADDTTKDFVGVHYVMGHPDQSTSGNYRHSVSDERLKNIADSVREWLFESDSKEN